MPWTNLGQKDQQMIVSMTVLACTFRISKWLYLPLKFVVLLFWLYESPNLLLNKYLCQKQNVILSLWYWHNMQKFTWHTSNLFHSFVTLISLETEHNPQQTEVSYRSDGKIDTHVSSRCRENTALIRKDDDTSIRRPPSLGNISSNVLHMVYTWNFSTVCTVFYYFEQEASKYSQGEPWACSSK